MIIEATPTFHFPKEDAPRPLTDAEQRAYQVVGDDFANKEVRDETIRLLNNEYDGTVGRLREKVHRFVGVPAMAEAITYARTGSYSPEYPKDYVFAPIVTEVSHAPVRPARIEVPLHMVFLDLAFYHHEEEKKKKKK